MSLLEQNVRSHLAGDSCDLAKPQVGKLPTQSNSHPISKERSRIEEAKTGDFEEDASDIGSYKIADVLDRGMAIGSSVEQLFKEGCLPSSHPFSWKTVQREPKGDHGVVRVRGNW